MKNDTLLVALAFVIVILCLLVCVVALWQPANPVLPTFSPSTSAPTVEQTQASTPPVPEPTRSPRSQPQQQQRKPQPQPSMNIPTPGRSPRPPPAPHPVSAPIPVRAGHLTKKILNRWPMPTSLPSGILPAPKMAAPPTPARTAVTAIWNWARAPWGTALAPGRSRKPLPKPPQELRSGNAPAARKPRR